MDLDVEIALEISAQIQEHSSKSQNKPSNIKSVVARRNQLRRDAMNNVVSDDDIMGMIGGE